MTAHVGDRILIESEKVAQPTRAGVIEEVLQQQPTRVRVKWDDGHTSILTPADGAARITSPRKRAKG